MILQLAQLKQVEVHDFLRQVIARSPHHDAQAYACVVLAQVLQTDDSTTVNHEEEIVELRASADHLAKLRDEVIEIGLLPPLDAWADINSNL